MKHKALLLSLSLFLCLFPAGPNRAQALNLAETERINQQIEILKQEVAVFKILLLNMQANKKITAPSYLAINLNNSSVLLNKNPEKPYPIASVTKLMNAVVTLETAGTEQTIVLTEEMLLPFGASPALYSGLNIKVENLLKASLIQSSNDAAEALSYFIGKDKFLEIMNQKAKELGMGNTVFYDAHGLNPENRSTASDLAKLLAYIYKNHPKILSITKNNDFWLPDQSQKLLKFKNANNFYPLSYFVGGKTGYLVEARQTLASIFDVGGAPIAVIALYSSNYQADAFAIIRKIK